MCKIDKYLTLFTVNLSLQANYFLSLLIKRFCFFTDKPKNTSITFTPEDPEKAIFGSTVDVTCKSDGFPEPSYTITHNGTEISNETKHTILVVKWDDEGIYKCIARNELGDDSDSGNLTVKGMIIQYS